MTQPLRCALRSAVYHGLWRDVIRLFLPVKRNGSTIDSRLATSQVKHPNCGKDLDRGETRTGYQKALRQLRR